MELPFPHIPDTSGASGREDPHHLIKGCQRDDRLCQEKLYKYYFDRMMSTIRRYTSDQDAAVTILNDGFLRAFRKIHQYTNQGSFEGWLRKIITHAVADYFKAHKLEESNVLPENLPALPQDPLAYKDMMLVLQRLPPATRVVINLFIIEGYSHKEIAAMLGISSGTSKWHVAEGRKLLQEMLAALFAKSSG